MGITPIGFDYNGSLAVIGVKDNIHKPQIRAIHKWQEPDDLCEDLMWKEPF